MTESILEHDNNVVRYCRPGVLNASKTRATGDAFKLDKGEVGISVDCLESLSSLSIVEKITELKAITGYGYSHNGKFAEMNVGEVLDKVLDEFSINLQVVNDRIPHDSHSEIRGLTLEDNLVFEFIAEETVSNLHSVSLV